MTRKEIWKDMIGYEGDYQISSFGRVRSVKFGKTTIRKPFICGKGYLAIDLCKNCKVKKKYIHRLVAEHFIDNQFNYPEVNHEDGNKLNNTRNNLSWVSGRLNMKHAREKLGFDQNGENSKVSKLKEKEVRKIIELYKSGGYSFRELAQKYKIASSSISNIINKVTWKHLKIA